MWTRAFLTISVALFAQDLSLYKKPISEATALARKQKKPLWIMFSATWCGPCKLMENMVLPQSTFQEAIQKDFVPLKVYAASGSDNTPGADSLVRRYRIASFPTFLCIEPSGEAFYRRVGLPVTSANPNQQELLQSALNMLEEAKRHRQDLPEMRKKFQKGERNFLFLREYLRTIVEIGDAQEIEAAFDAYIKQAPSIWAAWVEVPKYYGILLNLIPTKKKYSDYALQIVDSLRWYLSPEDFEALYMAHVEVSFARSIGRSKSWGDIVVAAEKFIRDEKARFPFVEKAMLRQITRVGLRGNFVGGDNPEVIQNAAELAIRYVSLLLPERFSFSEEQKEHLAEELNNVAWEFYERVSATDKLWVAVGWAKLAVAWKPTAWHIWDTLGALYFRLGRKSEALEALDKAIRLAKETGVPENEYEETLELRGKAAALPD
ncbi:MAG: thioredoxin family protein [Bacteroidia bacterium]|nr:thioredoxin family protein [Bacteroidia bacterium]